MLSSKSKIAVAVLSILLTANLAKSAFAGSHAEAMSEWTARVTETISAKMINPRGAFGREGHNVAEFTVARDGTVVEAIILQASDRPAFNIATKKTLRRVSRLPSPPKSLTGDQVKVRVFMIYADTPVDSYRLAERLEPALKLMASQASSRKDSPLVTLVGSN